MMLTTPPCYRGTRLGLTQVQPTVITSVPSLNSILSLLVFPCFLFLLCLWTLQSDGKTSFMQQPKNVFCCYKLFTSGGWIRNKLWNKDFQAGEVFSRAWCLQKQQPQHLLTFGVHIVTTSLVTRIKNISFCISWGTITHLFIPEKSFCPCIVCVYQEHGDPFYCEVSTLASWVCPHMNSVLEACTSIIKAAVEIKEANITGPLAAQTAAAHLWRTRIWYWIGAASKVLSSPSPCRLRQPEVRHWAWESHMGQRDSTRDTLERNGKKTIWYHLDSTGNTGTTLLWYFFFNLTCTSRGTETCWRWLTSICRWSECSPRDPTQVSLPFSSVWFPGPTSQRAAAHSWWRAAGWRGRAPTQLSAAKHTGQAGWNKKQDDGERGPTEVVDYIYIQLSSCLFLHRTHVHIISVNDLR